MCDIPTYLGSKNHDSDLIYLGYKVIKISVSIVFLFSILCFGKFDKLSLRLENQQLLFNAIKFKYFHPFALLYILIVK